MKTTLFQVSVQSFETLQEIKGAWTSETLRNALQALDYDGVGEIPDDELKDMLLMTLQDLEPAEAAEALLGYQFPKELTPGQRKNISHEMVSDKLWEEYSDLSMHEGLFNLATLLHQAFPRKCPKPDAVRVLLRVTAKNSEAKRLLGEPLKEPFMVRLAADGMTDRAILHRLFDEQLEGNQFPEASFVIWNFEQLPSDEETVDITITSSGHWFDALRDTQEYESTAHGDDT
jgi:hypothetical protein